MTGEADFRAALLDPKRPAPDGLMDGSGRPAGRRFDVYRNNVAASLTEALETAFPVIAKLLGETNFRHLAGVFLREHPPEDPVMMFYGHQMPTFLAGFDKTSKIGYLPDVARLELALRESYHAADADPIRPEALQDLVPNALSQVRLCLAPSLRLVRSRWPVHAIWLYNTEAGAPKPEMTPQDVVVLRPALDPEPILLPPGGGAFVDALADGESLGSASERGAQASPDFDLALVLTRLIQGGAITKIGN